MSTDTDEMMVRLPVVVVIVFVAAVAVATIAQPTVARRRLELFALRQRLAVTAANGEPVITYLATTRRWRTAGMAIGIITTLVWWAWFPAVTDSFRIGVDFRALFAGWFAGAVVAEMRLVRRPKGSQRAASLRTRLASAYLPRGAWLLMPLTAGAAIVVAVAGALAELAGRAQFTRGALAWLGCALAITAAVRLTQRWVLRRPQPLDEPDVIAADDAIRSRSLHVLAGGGFVLVAICVLNEVSAVTAPGSAIATAIAAFELIAVFAVALIGWLVGGSVWPPSRSAGPEPQPS